MKRTIYYGHHMWKYNTPIESYEIDMIKSCFPDYIIINPNGFVNQSASEGEIMLECFKNIYNADEFVFSTLSGVIGKGLFQEILFAQSAEKPIYCIENGHVFRPAGLVMSILNQNNNRSYATVQIVR